MIDVRWHVLRAAALFYQRGWMAGTAGNLSARAADKHSFWITASGCSKGQLTEEDLLRVSLEGGAVERAHDAQRPSAEASIHRAVYATLPEVGAVFHVHTIESNLLTALHPGGVLLPALEMLKGFGVMEAQPRIQVPVLANHQRVESIADDLQALLQKEPPAIPAMLIAAHGLTTWAPTATQCLHQVELLDYMFRYAIAARQLGVG